MRKALVYKLCLWTIKVLPIVLFLVSFWMFVAMDFDYTEMNEGAISVLIISTGYIIYWRKRRYTVESGRSRARYEGWFFLLMGILLCLYIKGFDVEKYIPSMSLKFCPDRIPLLFRICQIVICVIIIISKVVLIVMATKDYVANSDERMRIRVEYDVEEARSKVEYNIRNGNSDETRIAEIELERAKERREQYYKGRE